MKTPTNYPEVWAALAAPFADWQVRNRPGGGGKSLSYITARTAMNRLDDVLGPENWSDTFKETRDGLMCSIAVKLPGGETVTKTDGGGFADMPEEDNVEKSAYSDAFKRAAVKFGVGRYLYQDKLPAFVMAIHQRQWAEEDAAGGGTQPAAEPGPTRNGHHAPAPSAPRPPASPAPARNGSGQAGNDRPPTSGKALFAWTKDMEQRYEVGLLKYLNDWSKLQDFPGRMVDWDADQVRLAHAEAVRKLNAVTEAARGKGEAYEDAISN